jgi:hypothetical protein
MPAGIRSCTFATPNNSATRQLRFWGAAGARRQCPQNSAPSPKQPRSRRRRYCRRWLLPDTTSHGTAVVISARKGESESQPTRRRAPPIRPDRVLRWGGDVHDAGVAGPFPASRALQGSPNQVRDGWRGNESRSRARFEPRSSRAAGSTATPASSGFPATTGRSASERRVGTQCLPVSAVGMLPLATLALGLRARPAVSTLAFSRSMQEPQTRITPPLRRAPPGQ